VHKDDGGNEGTGERRDAPEIEHGFVVGVFGGCALGLVLLLQAFFFGFYRFAAFRFIGEFYDFFVIIFAHRDDYNGMSGEGKRKSAALFWRRQRELCSAHFRFVVSLCVPIRGRVDSRYRRFSRGHIDRLPVHHRLAS
jgi:hypothetical protein